MNITLAETAGFCFGVDRAVRLLEEVSAKSRSVCTLGPIIHNPTVISHFESRGVRIIEKPAEASETDTIVIRAHGVTKEMLKEAEMRVQNVCNATCPFVTKIHKIVARESENNTVLIAGDSRHPEVQGIRSYCKGESFVFNSLAELEEIIQNHPNLQDTGLIFVSQTTFSTKEWQKCVKKIKLVYTNAGIFDTICDATEKRQREAASLSLVNDAMVIIGGRQSSNTAKLKAVCENACPTFLIETAAELKDIDFSSYQSIGVTAGASTPDSIIKEALKTMSEMLETQNPMEASAAEVSEKEEAVQSFDEMNFAEALEESLKNMSTDQQVTGVVVGISPTEIQVDIGRKHAGYVPFSEYSSDPTVDPAKEVKVGDEMKLIIMKTNDLEGTVMLSKRRYDAMAAWDELSEDSDEILEGTVTGVVGEGKGLFVQYGGIRVFVPASLAKANRSDSLEEMVKQKVSFKIIEVDKKKRRVVGSVRAALKDARKAAEEKFWETAEEGQVINGVVRSLTTYGAFVDIGGVDGMVHISELSWQRIKHPSDVVKVGDTIEVYIKKLDAENKKISLGYKKIEDNPWEILKRDYPVGTELDTKIVGLTTFGAFASVIPGVDGLIHISEISHDRIGNPAEVLKVGDSVRVKVLDVDFDKKRVSLSIKALTENEAEEAAE